jgi:hypothetical protein
MLLTSVNLVLEELVLLVVEMVVRHISLVIACLTSVLTVVTVVVLAATCAAAPGELYAATAVMVPVRFTTVLTVVHMATLVLVKCGVKIATAGTSNLFHILVV